jgi:hypothetical protein
MTSVARPGLVVACIIGLGALSGACAAPSPQVQPTGSASATAFDPSAEGADWQPRGEAALEEGYQDYLEYLQKTLQVSDPPDVALVRFVSVDDWPHIVSECITSAGFPVRISQGGVVLDGDVPDEQADALNLAWYTCQAAYPVDQRTQEPLPRVRAEKQYDHLVDNVAPCVRAEGFDVPQAPSLESWLDAYYTDGAAWDPFTVVGEVAPEKLDAIYTSCPHDAADLYPESD